MEGDAIRGTRLGAPVSEGPTGARNVVRLSPGDRRLPTLTRSERQSCVTRRSHSRRTGAENNRGGVAMYVRVVRFTDVSADRMAGPLAPVGGVRGAPPGGPPTRVEGVFVRNPRNP